MATQSRSSASSRPVKRSEPNVDATRTKLVRFEIDLANPPPLTDAQRAEIDALSEDAIDTSDIPVLRDIASQEFIRGKYYRPTKTSTTVRLDSDVLAWLRSQGRGYQTRINAILRREMLAALKKS